MLMSERAPEERELAAAGIIGRGVTALAARARSERAGELTLNQVSVLGRLTRFRELTPKEVAAQLRLQPQGVTRTLQSLEHHGWITRMRDPADGRQSLLTITEAGRAVLADEMRPRYDWLADAMAHVLTPTERDLLVLAADLLVRVASVDASPVTREPLAE